MIQKKLGFTYSKTDTNFIAIYRDGKWEKGALQKADEIKISITSPALHYGQEAFEGLKAYRTKDGHVNLFRPYENAKRFQHSADRLGMPRVDLDFFVDAVKAVVLDNEKYVPEYGSGATLYVRPYLIGVGHNIGLRPAAEYIFGVVVMPVGNYFGAEAKSVDLLISEYDRAAPFGTGSAKVGGNYAASLYPQMLARTQGYGDCLYLDAKTRTKIEELGAANFFGITKNNEYITPESPSILKSITNDSLMYLAKEYLKIEVSRADIYIDQLDHLVEAGACGTAAVITPVRSITHNGHKHVISNLPAMGPITQKLYDLLTGIQFGDLKGPEGWVIRIK
ncbi:MAG: branched-chain amino acid aminotransferase [Acholeplasmataceae bacterium]